MMSSFKLVTLCCFYVFLVACGNEESSAPILASDPVTDTGGELVPNVPATPELGTFGIDLTSQNPSIRPGDDFFRFANGKWLDDFELPSDRSNYGSFTVLSDRSDQRVRGIIDDLTSTEPVAGSIEQKISDYYLSYMGTEILNRLGIQPLITGLATLNEIGTQEELVAGFGRAMIDNTASPFGFYVGADRSNPDRHQLVLSVGGLGLPDRDYYLIDTEQYENVRKEYVAHIARVLDLANLEDTIEKANKILALETQIAEHTWPRDQRRNRDLTYNPMTYAEFLVEYPGFNWNAYFAAAGIQNLEDLNVSYPSAMYPIIDLVSNLPLDDWKSYMTYRFIVDNASVLSEEVDEEAFHFYSRILNGVPEQRQRWERGVLRVGALNSLGEAVGQLYVERHFPESAKQQMTQLVENLRASLAQSIEDNDWMNSATKEEANKKLEFFRPKIAYPDEWKDLSPIDITRDNLFQNAQNVREYNYQDEIGRLGNPTNREEWGMTPQTVNAYYNSSFNEIVFPAGILQPPFFDPSADPAVNYGGIGAVIGHEMGHGFDDQGSKSDFAGIQRNWWTDEDRTNFEVLTAALAMQYGKFEPVPGYFIDGNFTLGENIGDEGGLSLA